MSVIERHVEAPEEVRSSVIGNGVQRIVVYSGPCRLEAFGRYIVRVETTHPLGSGELYFIVPQDRETANGLVPIVASAGHFVAPRPPKTQIPSVPLGLKAAARPQLLA